MITNAGVSTELAKGAVVVFDVVTLVISRGRIIRFPGGAGTDGILTPITDTVRWTSCPVPLRVYGIDGSGPYLYSPIPPGSINPLVGAAYSRDKLRQVLGREVVQIGMTVSGNLPINLTTACDVTTGVQSGSFATTLMELCHLGLLDGAVVTIDQVVLPAGQLPSTPAAAGAAYGIVSTTPVRRFFGVVQQASPSNETVTLTCCDPLVLGGGSVPVGVFSPQCRWDFCDGRCPVAYNLQTIVGNGSGGTHKAVSGSAISFPNSSTVLIPMSDWVEAQGFTPWCMLVPQDGPMMGMRFQVGSNRSFAAGVGTYDFADSCPWTWSCTTAHVEGQCSKLLSNPVDPVGGQRAPDCELNDFRPSQSGMPTSLNRFSGCPDMPQPESA